MNLFLHLNKTEIEILVKTKEAWLQTLNRGAKKSEAVEFCRWNMKQMLGEVSILFHISDKIYIFFDNISKRKYSPIFWLNGYRYQIFKKTSIFWTCVAGWGWSAHASLQSVSWYKIKKYKLTILPSRCGEYREYISFHVYIISIISE